MSLVKWRDRSTLPTVSTFFDNFFRDDEGFLPTVFRDRTVPAVNVFEDEKYFKVEVAAPGMKRDDFNVSFETNMLVITSEKEDKKEEEGKNWTRKEYNYHSFQRSFWMPENIMADKITATYKDGILAISVPKKEVDLKQTKTIEVK